MPKIGSRGDILTLVGDQQPVMLLLAAQHYMLLERNLVYTGATRGMKLVIIELVEPELLSSKGAI